MSIVARIREFFRHPAERGATFLDGAAPGWAEKVDVASLDIFSAKHCILGQVFGSYGKGICTLRLTPGDEALYGFINDDYRDRWVREVESRRTS